MDVTGNPERDKKKEENVEERQVQRGQNRIYSAREDYKKSHQKCQKEIREETSRRRRQKQETVLCLHQAKDEEQAFCWAVKKRWPDSQW